MTIQPFNCYATQRNKVNCNLSVFLSRKSFAVFMCLCLHHLLLYVPATHAAWYEQVEQTQRRPAPQSWTFLGLSHLNDYVSRWFSGRASSSRTGRSDPYSARHNRHRDSRLMQPYAQRQTITDPSTIPAASLVGATRVAKSLHFVPGQLAPPPQTATKLLLPPPDRNNKLGTVDGVENDIVDYNIDGYDNDEQWPNSAGNAPPPPPDYSSDSQQLMSTDDSLRQLDHMRLCDAFLSTVPRQHELCRANAEVFWRIREAAQLAVGECKRQFEHERWNCSSSDPARLFGQTLKRSSKEEAFVSAISSAAVVHSVVKACSSGNLSFCSCDTSREKQQQHSSAGWSWGGCSDDLKIGEAFAEAFVDAPQKAMARTKELDIHSQIDLHNNAAGRMIIKQHMQRHCRCHGVSGSCEMRTCWEQMPSFQQIGKYLKAKYDKSVRVGKRFKKKLRRRGRAERFKPIQDDELVYLRRSPNYCEPDPKRGIFGTQGRTCNRTSTGPDSCNQLCCGRGYATRVEKRIHRCDCKFVWCCEVRCKTCITETEVFVCM